MSGCAFFVGPDSTQAVSDSYNAKVIMAMSLRHSRPSVGGKVQMGDHAPQAAAKANVLAARLHTCSSDSIPVEGRLHEDRLRLRMRVQDVMVKSPATCSVATNLAEAAALLWTGNCGALPVIDAAGKLEGIVTDRDICIAVGTKNRKPSEITVGQAMSRNVVSCHPGDDVHAALKTMRFRKVRRLPVICDDRKLVGTLSISELLLHARHDDGSRPELSNEDIMSALRGIYVHCPPHCERA